MRVSHSGVSLSCSIRRDKDGTSQNQNRPSTPFRSAARHRAASCRYRYQATLSALVALVLALSTADAGAIGPILPLEFRDVDRGIELVFDPTQIAKVDTQRILYDHGRPLREQRLDLRPERRADGVAVAMVPLLLEQFSDLQPGYYALKLVAVGAPSDPKSGAVPLQIERWLYFAVDKAGVRRVSNEEYSDAVDPAELGRNDIGRQILLHKGGSREGKVPLQDTERGQAIPLGRTGAVEELTTQGYQVEAAAPRRDESQER